MHNQLSPRARDWTQVLILGTVHLLAVRCTTRREVALFAATSAGTCRAVAVSAMVGNATQKRRQNTRSLERARMGKMREGGADHR